LRKEYAKLSRLAGVEQSTQAHAGVVSSFSGFPREEVYGITSQLRRAAVSIGANLAEGCGRRTSTELARFVRIAMGSASELDYHLLLSKDLGFMNNEDFARSASGLTEVRKMLTSFLSSVEEQIELKSKAAGTT
jgi:four helix bundle protein